MQNSSWFIYVINLDRSKDRMEKIESQLNQLKFPFHRISGIDGALCQPDELALLDRKSYEKLHGKRPILGELGCYLSHVKTIHEFLKSKYQYAVILEDDISLPTNLEEVLNGLVCAKNEWDMVKLSGVHNGNPMKLFKISNEYSLSILATKCTGSSAYVINRKAAAKYLQAILPMQLPYDHEFDKAWKYGIKVRAINPFPIQHENLNYSLIGTTDNRKFKWYKKFPTYSYRLKNEITRFIYSLFCLVKFLLLKR